MKKILIVEDVDMNIDLLRQLLEDDFEVVIARNGEEGVARAQAERPDLILMDISLPLKDGYDATREIKSIDFLHHIPVIAVTAHAMNGDREKALAAGCDEFLTKPIDDDILFDTLERFLG
ncbi:MAG: response regulator [Anaerolineae bacterium]|nr:response regulator [Anaerolineae bacterium]